MFRFILFFVALLFVLPAVAFGDDAPVERHGLVLNQLQLWALVIGALSPLVGYVMNTALVKKAWRTMPEPVAALIHALIAAIATGIYQAASTNSFGWNSETLQLIVTALASAFAAHGLMWKPAGVQARLAKRPVVHHTHGGHA